mmetsp:Transcript_157855/g.302942  ORF Transcript_157855/g.302942 Transcript_157855/m.302942 type:complete len:107 (-) Transcript_157855:1255-1575(-)
MSQSSNILVAGHQLDEHVAQIPRDIERLIHVDFFRVAMVMRLPMVTRLMVMRLLMVTQLLVMAMVQLMVMVMVMGMVMVMVMASFATIAHKERSCMLTQVTLMRSL